MSKFIKLFLPLLLLTCFGCQEKPSPPQKATYAIIPAPAQLEKKEGFFLLDKNTKIIVSSEEKELLNNAYYFHQVIQNTYGLKLPVEVTPSIDITDENVKNSILFLLAKSTTENSESYGLSVTPEQVRITSPDGSGSFYAVQTLLQLIQEETPFIAAAEIEDAPRYAYRGMHLDVGRHFFPPDFIKKYIDFLSRYKYNSFHWHLTEDQGWRIEIKKYPKLQEVAAFRKETLIGHYSDKPHQFDGERYGGFYTQEEIKDIVAYAKERHITVIPEIEMPGHARAALAAYPELACTDGPIEVATKWGVFEEVYCPTETTFSFLEDVLTEVMELFPSKYIHIGGDECPKTAWENSAFCQELIKKEGLKDEHELQSYFIQRMEKFLNSKGRNIIGWDEILEGGLAPNATVMSWRGMKGGIEAAEQGHDVIMTPGSHCYFDHYQSDSPDEPLAIGGFTSLEKVYSFEPTPAELTEEQAKHILGAQGNVWTEYMKTPEKVEYMIFPRMCALAEVLWSPKEKRNFKDFMLRLEPHIEKLQKEGINVANHTFDVKATIKSGDGTGIRVSLMTDSDTPIIRYATDGSKVSVESPEYTTPVLIEKSGSFQAASFKNGMQAGRGLSLDFNIHKAAGKKIELENAPSEKYNSGGNAAIFNGLLGSDKRYGDTEWLGFSGEDCIATINLGESLEINKIKFRFFNGPGQWIYPPKSVEILVSEDGQTFSKAGELTDIKADGKILTPELVLQDVKGKFLKIHIYRHGIIGEGLQGAGHEAWLFVDEIVVE